MIKNCVNRAWSIGKQKKSSNEKNQFMFLNPASPISFSNFPHEDTCEIISDHLIKYEIRCLYTFKKGTTRWYIKRVCERHKIGFLKTCGYQYHGHDWSEITHNDCTTHIFLPRCA